MPPTLTVNEVAEIMRCSPKHIKRLISDGQLGAVDISRRRVRQELRITQHQLDEFMAVRPADVTIKQPRRSRRPTRKIEPGKISRMLGMTG